MASTGQQVLDEVDALRALPSVKCRVIERVGEFQFVISVTRDSLTVKLQLTDNYPLEAPCISVRSDQQQQQGSQDLEARLKSMADSLTGAPMLAALAEAALPASGVGLTALPVDATAQQQQQQQRRQQQQQRKNRRAARRAAAAADGGGKEHGGKLKSMKTADDVLKRIHWDESIPQEDITIGYVDRFKGVVEKPFDAFSWEDIASVDYYTFVIPRHRICHFRYRRAVVWDKRRRIDLVFGSVGAPPGANIRDFIAAYRDEDYAVDNLPASASDDDDDESLESDDSDDSDDSVEVRLDRRLVANAAADDSEGDDYANDDEDEDGGRRVPRRPTREAAERHRTADMCRPNFFVCIRIEDPSVAETVRALQSRLVEAEPLYDSCCIPPTMLHCTLLTLRLDSAEEIADCAATLQAVAPELRNSLPRQPLRLSGTGCFHGRVLHARVQHGDDFLPFVHHLQAAVRSDGHRVLDTHDFVPHVTIMKTTRPVSRQLGSRFIPQHLLAGYEETHFGEQAVESLYLCSMEKERRPDGFYMTPGCVTFERQIV